MLCILELNNRDEIWNQSLVERKLEFEIMHVRNNANTHDQEDDNLSRYYSRASISFGDGTS
jgi:hypothetical protein